VDGEMGTIRSVSLTLLALAAFLLVLGAPFRWW
jgi:hypothetical protein